MRREMPQSGNIFVGRCNARGTSASACNKTKPPRPKLQRSDIYIIIVGKCRTYGTPFIEIMLLYRR